jgi:hypothetical protein
LIDVLDTYLNWAFDPEDRDFVVEIPDFNLGANQEYNINFEMGINNASVFLTSYPRFAVINFSSVLTPPAPGSSVGISTGTQQDERSIEIENASTISDLYDKIEEYENGAFYPIEQLEIVINGTFYVDEDFDLDERWTIKLKDNARIEVINNSTFTVMNNMIGPCMDSRWDEIYVEKGSNISFHNVMIKKGTNGIITQNDPQGTSTLSDIKVTSCSFDDFTDNAISIKTNSTIQLQGIDINNVGGYGIDLAGNVDAQVLIGVNINDAETGIRIHNSSNWNQVNDCTFIDCIFGVRYHGASGSIHDSKFRNTRIGISLLESNLTYIYKNSIGYHTSGISVEKSNGVSINRNEIGIPSDYGSTSIFLSEVNYSSILGNQNMLASNFGIQGIQINNLKIQGWSEPGSEIITSHNNINIQGNQNTFSGGISLTMANKCEITDNFIFASEVAYGIETNNATSSKIRNNYVSIASIPNMFRSAAIKNSAGVSAYVLDNETYSSDNANGIEVQNTSFSHYNCNDIYDTHDALCIEHNSDIQELGTNHMVNAHNIDFITRSRLGIQRNKGNIYEGNKVRGYFETIQDRDESIFFVDEDETGTFHMPADRFPVGNDWYKTNTDSDDVCLSNVGPTGQTIFFSSVTRLCDYWDDIKSLKNSDPKLFLIKLTHLIRYFDAHPLLDIPDCIELDPMFINLCGFHDIMDVVGRLNTLGDIDPTRTSLENDISELITLNDSYSLLIDESKKEAKMQEIQVKFNATKPALDQETISDAIDMNIINSDLQSVNCNEELINIMQKTWQKYIEELNADHTDLNTRIDSDIESTSKLCSDEYGDAVHLARSIASIQGSSVYYDVNDGCRDTGYSSPRQKNHSDINMVISPNPSYGILNVDFGEEATGSISVINTSGVQMLRQRIINTSVYNLDIDASGMYIIKFVHENGEVVNKKALIIN